MALDSGHLGVSKTPTVIGTLEGKTRYTGVVAPEDLGSNLLSSQSRNVFTYTCGFSGLCSPQLFCDKITFILKSWHKTSFSLKPPRDYSQNYSSISHFILY